MINSIHTTAGSSASKYASSDVKSTMTIDDPKTMLDMTKIKNDTQQRRQSVKQNTKVPVVSGVKSSFSRLTNTRKGS